MKLTQNNLKHIVKECVTKVLNEIYEEDSHEESLNLDSFKLEDGRFCLTKGGEFVQLPTRWENIYKAVGPVIHFLKGAESGYYQCNGFGGLKKTFWKYDGKKWTGVVWCPSMKDFKNTDIVKNSFEMSKTFATDGAKKLELLDEEDVKKRIELGKMVSSIPFLFDRMPNGTTISM